MDADASGVKLIILLKFAFICFISVPSSRFFSSTGSAFRLAGRIYDQPEGRLVHNLEYGYIIFWYNCTVLSESACTTLKDQIKSIITAEKEYKVIA